MNARLLTLMLVLASPIVASAEGDLVATIQRLRASGCEGRGGTSIALRRVRELDRAARALAEGRDLDEAIRGAGYPALQSAMLEATGSDAAIAGLLSRRGCRDIADPAYLEFGLASRDGGAWLVLAAPLDPPAAGDAGAIGARVLELVNEARAQPRRCGRKSFEAAPALSLSEPLHRAALAHARDMAARSELTHASHDGASTADRVSRTGYRWRVTGENIAAGQPTPERVVADWLDSPRHCANLMDPEFREMGVAYAFEPGSEKGIYWAQVFGTLRR